MFLEKTPLIAASKRRFQKGETGKGAGNSICTGGTQADTASESTGNAEAERLACLPSCYLVPFAQCTQVLLAGSQPSISDILAIGGDTLGEVLDKREGYAVTDKNIYRCSTCLLYACCQPPGTVNGLADMLHHISYAELQGCMVNLQCKHRCCAHIYRCL